MFCALSGEPPEHPVVSKKTGCLFEKRVIDKYIAEHGKEPGTDDVLTEDDLLEITVVPKTVKPRPPTMSSVPAMLTAFQNEWDSIMLETYTLKEKYTQVRQELSHALYQHDAACRVIARLMQERDAAREALANVQVHVGAPVKSSEDATPMEVDEEGALPQSAIDHITDISEQLVKTRRKRKAPEGLAKPDHISKFTPVASAPSLHSASSPGITCMDYDSSKGLVVTGGMDKNAEIYNRHEEKVLATLKGHTKKINSVAWHNKENDNGRLVFTGSADKTVRIWQPSSPSKYSEAYVIKEHKGEVTGVGLHATGSYIASAAMDSTWALHDIETGRTLTRSSNADDKGYTCMDLHPDGVILATGTTNEIVQIWDIKSRANVASFPGHPGRISAINFSENGYYCATASAGESSVQLWDLRKLKNFHTIDLPDSANHVRSLAFDYSGTYLAAGGMDLRVWKVKGWSECLVREDHTAEVTGVRFGELANEIVTSSLDRSIQFYGAE